MSDPDSYEAGSPRAWTLEEFWEVDAGVHEEDCPRWRPCDCANPREHAATISGPGGTAHLVLDGTRACTCDNGPYVSRGSLGRYGPDSPRGGGLQVLELVQPQGAPSWFLMRSHEAVEPGSIELVLDDKQAASLAAFILARLGRA